MTVHFKQVAIIGVGLIGGSLGMILRQKILADQVIGVGRRVENLETAVCMGAIDRYVADPKEAWMEQTWSFCNAGGYLSEPSQGLGPLPNARSYCQ